MRVLVIASHNRAKSGEMVQILSQRLPELEIRTLVDYPGAPEPEESGSTYAENALIKARSAQEFTGEWALADDAGLEIDALGGAPGLHSKRFEGEATSFDEKMAKVLDLMADVPEGGRTARFRCCVALAAPRQDVQPAVLEAVCEGRIARRRTGTGGFGYDSIFFLPELGVTMAELTPDQKHAVSHRGKALQLLVEHLQRERILSVS